ncbi:MAG: hypothetical protein EP329_07780 [Deltaproteobacteria bacterium]|nr:MAG: hypothetical protein EP329_07780 [Deltaproteobacteria bacterium]
MKCQPSNDGPPEAIEYPDGEVLFDARSQASIEATRESLRRRYGLTPTLSSEPRGLIRRLRRLFSRHAEPRQRGGAQ